ncbi:hypothetical protein ACWDUL_33780 [Nocardia niigatensis]
MSNQATVPPAFVVAHNNPDPFAIDADALLAWIADDEPTVADCLPLDGDTSATDLARLVDAAYVSGALTGDPRLELIIDADNHHAGYVLMLRDRTQEDGPALTAGFTGLSVPDTELYATTAAAARYCLGQVIDNANYLITSLPDQTEKPKRRRRAAPRSA